MTHRYEWVVLVATLAVIPVMVIELETSSSGWRAFAFAVNWLIWAIFVAEMVFILKVAPRKQAALRAHWLDVTIIVVTAPLFSRLLASLRLVRLVRILRLLRLSAILTRALQREHALSSGAVFRFVAVLTVAAVVLGGSVEALIGGKDFHHSTWNGIWRGVVTVTTVGYGDIKPTTLEGQIVALVVMIAGIGFLSVLTAALASVFVKTDTGSEYEDLAESLRRIELELADLKRQLAPDQTI